MTQLQMAATAILALFFLAVAGHPGLAATPRNSESATVIAISPMKAAAQSHLQQPLQGQFLCLQGAAQLTAAIFKFNQAQRGF